MFWFLTNITALPVKQFHRRTFVATGTAPLPRYTGATTAAHVARLPRAISALTNSAAVSVVSSCSFSTFSLNLYHCRCVAAGEPAPTRADMPLHAAPLTMGRRGPAWPRGPRGGHAPLVAGPHRRRASSRPGLATSRPPTRTCTAPGQTRRPPRGGQCQQSMVKTAPRRTK